MGVSTEDGKEDWVGGKEWGGEEWGKEQSREEGGLRLGRGGIGRSGQYSFPASMHLSRSTQNSPYGCA